MKWVGGWVGGWVVECSPVLIASTCFFLLTLADRERWVGGHVVFPFILSKGELVFLELVHGHKVQLVGDLGGWVSKWVGGFMEE